MELEKFLEANSSEILNEAQSSLQRSQLKHYANSHSDENYKRLEDLFYFMIDAIRKKNLLPMTEHAEKIAKKRFESAFDFYEVHSAFNVLEEAVWKKVVNSFHPPDLGSALGMVSTVLGAGKETLACSFISLTSTGKNCSMDVSEMFKR